MTNWTRSDKTMPDYITVFFSCENASIESKTDIIMLKNKLYQRKKKQNISISKQKAPKRN